MAKMAWNSNFSVGDSETDEQHRQIFELINALDEAVHQHQGSERAKEVLGELVRYTQVHFAAEEALMRGMKYPNYEMHKQLHEALVFRVVTFVKRLEAGENVTFELINFLREWLMNHILKVDKDYGVFMAQGGAPGKVAEEPKKPGFLARLLGIKG